MPGRTGRRPLPTEVKRAHGERRPSRLNPREPRPEPGQPPRPSLSRLAAQEWKRLVEITLRTKVLTKSDGPILEAAAVAHEEMLEARRIVAKEGRFYETETRSGSVMKRPHPAIAVGADAWRRYVQALAHLGLSPATRSKVSITGEVEKDAVELWLLDGGKRA